MTDLIKQAETWLTRFRQLAKEMKLTHPPADIDPLTWKIHIAHCESMVDCIERQIEKMKADA
jgi:hypothetical protein